MACSRMTGLVRNRPLSYFDFFSDLRIENDMHEHDAEYCEFKEITTIVATWNAGATTPSSLRHEDKDNNFFREVIQPKDPPDILVFGFQELVDLEDKRLTAS